HILGFASDFNQGWFLSAENIEINVEVASSSELVTGISMRFLVNSRHRMLEPEEVEISINEGVYEKISKTSYRMHHNVAYLEYPVELKKRDKLKIRIKKNNQIEKSVIACDEIQLF